MKLSKVERLLFANQFRILEKLYPDDAEYYENSRIALEEGFVGHYGNIFEGISDDELSEEECGEVIEILNMYRAITFSYKNLDDKEGISDADIRFEGFDLNDQYEGKLVVYARYFINNLNRFIELKYGKEYADCNSHCCKIDDYRRMLNIWGELDKKMKLSNSEIKRLVNY
ncbi:MAG: YfbU family protein [Clostridium sp.]